MITVVPADNASWDDIQTIFGTRGAPADCWCQRNKLGPREAFRRFPAEERAARLREQTDAGNPGSGETSGLVAYVDGEPAGWCAVEPRPAYVGMVRNGNRVPWLGRVEDRTDVGVWAITCFVTRIGFRKRGVATALAAAAVDHARARGARAVEAYPIVTTSVISDELHPGLPSMFTAAGMTEVHRASLRRAVMRVDFRTA